MKTKQRAFWENIEMGGNHALQVRVDVRCANTIYKGKPKSSEEGY